MAKKPEKETPEQKKAAFLKASKAAAKKWKAKRTVDPGASFSQPEMEDGQYIAQITGMNVGAKDGKPWASITWKVQEGENKGDRPNKFYNLDSDSGMEQLSKDLQRAGYDIAELELPEVADLAEEINEEQPTVKITVKNNTGKRVDPKTKKKVDANYLNVYVDSLIEDYEADEDDGDDEEEEEEAETSSKGGKGGKKPPKKGGKKAKDDDEEEEEEEDEEEEDEEEEEEEESEDPEKGNAVSYKAKGKKKATEWTVTKVNAAKKTVDLKNEDGDTVKGVPFDEVTLVFEDDE